MTIELCDKIETDPPELQGLLLVVFTSVLSKSLAALKSLPWTQRQEAAHQEKVGALVSAAKQRGLEFVTVIAVKPDGRRVAHGLSIDRISADRALQ